MATLTTAGKIYIAQLIAGEATSTGLYVAVGYGDTAESESDTALEHEYTTNGLSRAVAGGGYLGCSSRKILFLHEFTVTTADSVVKEVGLFSSGGAALIMRHVFEEGELENGGVFNVGFSFYPFIYLTMDIVDESIVIGESPYVYATTFSLQITPSVGIGAHEYICTTAICYNGVALRNPCIKSISDFRGGKTWEIECYTEDYTDIENIVAKAAPVTLTKDIRGYQYAQSYMLKGTLNIKLTDGTNSYDSYTNCLVDDTITVEPFGIGWNYTVTIIESYS